jgi:putative restriction endonuclease
LARLKVDRASGDPAPHKPLLLLVVLDLAEQGLLPPEELEPAR